MKQEYIIKKRINAFKCLRCKHEWIPRVSMKELEGEFNSENKPRICPNCKSAYWDILPKNKGGKKK